MRHSLTLHPAASCAAVSSIEVDVTRRLSDLTLTFQVFGAVNALRLPLPTPPQRADRLWQHTCCEAFIGFADSRSYWEFNFSPSTQWAAYGFTDYRAGMQAVAAIDPPTIQVRSDDSHWELQAMVALAPLLDAATDVSLVLGLAAVVEAQDGSFSYWALAHPQGKPDFHHPTGRLLTVPADLHD
jgi:hypothetical protein